MPVVADPSRQWSIKKRVDLIYSNAFVANIATMIIASLLVLAIRSEHNPVLIWSWFGLICLIAAIRLILAYRYRIAKGSASINDWAKRYTVCSLLMGCTWALAAYFYHSLDKPEAKALVFMLLIGIIASAMIVLSAVLRTFYSHILPIFMGLLIVLFMNGSEYKAYLITGVLLYLVFISAAGLNTCNKIIESIQYQHENQDLISNLEEEITHRKHAQQELEDHREKLEELVDRRTRQLQSVNKDLEQEIKIRKKAEEKLKHIAYHDELTKLPNRLLLLDRLGHALVRAKRHKTIVAVMYVDLNGFKQINDTYGHATGDQLLLDVSKRLQEALRDEDTIARFGGDEFVVLIEHGGGRENASVLSNKIIEILGEPFVVEDKLISVGCSIGISIFPQDGEDVGILLDRADTAMYRAKKEEENAFHFFS